MPILSPIDFFELKRKAIQEMMDFVGLTRVDLIAFAPRDLDIRNAFYDPQIDKYNIILEEYVVTRTNPYNYQIRKLPLTAEMMDFAISKMMPVYRTKYLETLVPNPVEFFNPLVFNQNSP